MDKFEKILRDKFQGHEANMPAGEWEKFSQRLEGLTPKPSPWKSYLAGGLAAATIGVSAFFLIPSGEKENTQKQIAVENTVGTTQSPVKTNSIASNHENAGQKEMADHTVSGVNESNNKQSTSPVENVQSNNPVVAEVKNNDNNKTNNKTTSNTNNTTTNVHTANENNKNNSGGNNTNNNGNTQVNHSVPVAVQLSEPEIGGNLREICQNTEVTFKAVNSHSDHDITWILNGEEVSNESEFKANFSKPGTQVLQLVYATVQEGKRLSKESEKRFIQVLAAPVADIEVAQMNDYSPEYMFKAPSADGNEYLWNFGDGKVQTGNSLVHVYRKKGEYNIALTVTGSNGCKTRKAEKVEIESDYNLLAPNTFTPNGDGLNDDFIPAALKIMTDSRFRMIIFDKSGKKIFETTRVDNPWDGRNSTTGAFCQPDAYVWRVELTRADGAKEEYMGSVTIMAK